MQVYFSILSVISGMMLMAVGIGMMAVFIPTVLGAAGFSTGQIGMVVTANAMGMFSACFAGGWLIRRVGHIRAFSCYASLVALAMLALSQVALLPLWLGLRFITGFCTNSVFMVAQSWVNEASPADKRGRIMSFFYVSFTVSLGGGAFLLTLIDASGSLPYLIAAACGCLAIIPVSTTLLASPNLPERFAVELRLWFRRCPVAIVGAFTSGALAMTLQGVGAIYGGLIGLASSSIALMMTGTQIGNLVFQWPLGAISDYVDRRYVLLCAALACFAVSLLLVLSPSNWLPLIVLCFAILAGCGESLYTLSTAHANDRAKSGDHLSLASTLLVVWAGGATVGPIVATSAMSRLGAIGMPMYFATVALAFGLYLLWRLSIREAAEHQPHEAYVPLPQSAMLADEAILYSDDKAVIREGPGNTDE